jgi:hypothetical protein
VTHPAVWERAKAAVKPNWSHYADPWAVVTTVYKNMLRYR